MARYDFRSPRLHVDEPLAAGATVTLSKPQGHYLADVLRLKAGDAVLLFNARDGEWRARLAPAAKRATSKDSGLIRVSASMNDSSRLHSDSIS